MISQAWPLPSGHSVVTEKFQKRPRVQVPAKSSRLWFKGELHIMVHNNMSCRIFFFYLLPLAGVQAHSLAEIKTIFSGKTSLSISWANDAFQKSLLKGLQKYIELVVLLSGSVGLVYLSVGITKEGR